MSESIMKETSYIRPSDIRKILIRVNNWIEDVIMISTAMRRIRNHFKEAKITILAKTWVVETIARGMTSMESGIFESRSVRTIFWP